MAAPTEVEGTRIGSRSTEFIGVALSLITITRHGTRPAPNWGSPKLDLLAALRASAERGSKLVGQATVDSKSPIKLALWCGRPAARSRSGWWSQAGGRSDTRAGSTPELFCVKPRVVALAPCRRRGSHAVCLQGNSQQRNPAPNRFPMRRPAVALRPLTARRRPRAQRPLAVCPLPRAFRHGAACSDGAGGRCQCMPVSVWTRYPPAVRGEASSEGTLSRARMIHNRRLRNRETLACQWGRCAGPGFKPRLEVGRAWPMAHWRCHAACCPGRSASLCAAVGQLARR